MTSEETINLLAGSPAGREMLLRHIATTESAAILVLDDILRDLLDPKLIKMAQRHRADEVRHAAMLRERIAALGIEVPENEPNHSLARLEALWVTLKPSTVPEKYAVLQVIEEQDAPLFGALAIAMRPFDPATADVFERMGRDEKSHVRYCHVIARELGGETIDETIAWYREMNDATRQPIGIVPEAQPYEFAKHFEMIQQWAPEQLSPDALGSGLVIPGLCCGFVGLIGGTRTAYFYGLRANPRVSMVARGRAILRLAPQIIQSARAAGFTAGVTSTSNSVVERFWIERLGFKRNGESVLTGAL